MSQLTPFPTLPPAPLQPVTLQGARVRLEPLSLAHVPALVAAASESRETYSLTYVPDGEAAMRLYVEAALAAQQSGAALPFATFAAQSGACVGSTRFGNCEYFSFADGRAHRPARCPDAVEIGWSWLAAHAQRTAINSGAKLLMLTHAFETLAVVRVNLRTDARNLRSRAAIERIGGKLDGLLRAHLPAAAGDGIRDTATYSILASEWPAVKRALEKKLTAHR